MKNVLLIGSYPPPYGGISIHIKRLTDILSMNGYRINILDITNVKYIKINENITIIPLRVRYFIEIIKSFLKSDIVHIHTSGYGRYWREMLLIVFSKITNNKTIITVNGGLFPKHVSKSSKNQSCNALLKSDKLKGAGLVWDEPAQPARRRPDDAG